MPLHMSAFLLARPPPSGRYHTAYAIFLSCMLPEPRRHHFSSFHTFCPFMFVWRFV